MSQMLAKMQKMKDTTTTAMFVRRQLCRQGISLCTAGGAPYACSGLLGEDV